MTRKAPQRRPAPGSRPPFGSQLRNFRQRRAMSQLDLALAAGVSPRHVSFVESGRSRPSQTMVLRLAETLDVPLRSRNDLLHLAGYAPAYPERRLEEPELSAISSIVDQMLRQHEPYPAFAIDRHWNFVRTNGTAERLFSMVLPERPFNAVALFFQPGPFRELVENWEEVAWVTLDRLRREVATAGEDEQLRGLLADAEEAMAGREKPVELDPRAPTVTTRLRLGEETVATISTIVSFNAARDVTLDELRVELVYPADEAAATAFRRLAG